MWKNNNNFRLIQGHLYIVDKDTYIKRMENLLNDQRKFEKVTLKNENKLFFLDVEIIREQGKFTTTVYRKPTFSGVYSNFESFLPLVYKFGMVYTLVY